MNRWLRIILTLTLWVSSVETKNLNREELIKMDTLLFNKATKAFRKGDYQVSLDFFQNSLKIRKKILPKEDTSTATSYNNIAFLYNTLGDYPNSIKYSQKALTIYKIIFSEKSIPVANSYNNIGLAYQSMGDYSKAFIYQQKALAIFKKILGKEHPDTATSYNNIGLVNQSMGNYPKALEYYQKSLAIREKVLGEKHPDTATSYNNIGFVYDSMGDYPKALGYFQKSLAIREKVLRKEHPDSAASYSNISAVYQSMGDYPKALKYYQKAIAILKKILGKEHPDTATSYNNIGAVYQSMGDYPKALEYHQKSLAIREKVLKKEHPSTAGSYYNIGVVYQLMRDYRSAHHHAQLAFNTFLKNRDKVFTILDSKQKEKYLKSTSMYITILLESSYAYVEELNKNEEKKKAQQILQSGANAWLNYKGSIFDSENAIAMLYASTKDTKLKVKIDDLLSSKRYLAKLYQSFPKAKEMDSWKKNIKNTEENIGRLTNEITSKASSFKEQQGLKSISYKNITSHLKENELYIDYAKVGGYYFLFSLDSKEHIDFIKLDSDSRIDQIDTLVKTFREDINTIFKAKNLTNEKLKSLTQNSKEKLSQLYNLLIKKPLAKQLKSKTSLIISPDGALRLLPFETLYNTESNKYFIEEKEMRYIPSGKELVRLYKYSKDKVSKSKKSAVIFANPNFSSTIAPPPKDENATELKRSGVVKSLVNMPNFSQLPGTKAEAKAIKTTLKKSSVSEYLEDEASEANFMKVKKPNILHVATHGFFINDDTIPNPMLKSGIVLAGANTSKILRRDYGIVTALKLSGLDLEGTDLVVLSACQTGMVDINSTNSVSGLSKAFIQAGAKDIVMSLWSVDDQATKELMASFYQQMKENKNYANALKSAKLKMIKEGRHPFFWAAFVVSGL